jgi:RHH-type transcriptional regulator, proline utilization regulon repressor / proline dehydrogenase / delta 1-pyrroline-5-carboxylate dehydrogenase
MSEIDDKYRARAILESATTARGRDELAGLAVELASILERATRALETPQERRRRRRTGRRLGTERGVALAVALADRFGRSRDPSRNVRTVAELAHELSPLSFLRRGERAAFEALKRSPPALDSIAAAAIDRALERELEPYLTVLDGPPMHARLEQIRAAGAEPILHLLGEEVVGEAQAEARADLEASLYERWHVSHLALKPSSIGSRFEPLGVDQTVARLLPRVRRIASVAAKRAHRSLVLDAESSDELEVTLRLLEELALDPRYGPVELGVALQAYLEDSEEIAERLIAIGLERAERGLAPLRIRLVKGANLGVERIRASLRGFPSAVRASKDETDRAARRLLERLASRDHAHAIHVAIGSHNLFDLAYALIHRAVHELGDALSFELLAGMADPLTRALRRLGGSCRVYLPVVEAAERHAAVAYLARRLDEQSAPSHFLPSSLLVDRVEDAYAEHRARFERSFSRTPPEPSVTEMRAHPRLERPFVNHPDLDLRDGERRASVVRALRLEASRARFDVLGTHQASRFDDGVDPSRPGHSPYRVGWADADGVRSVLDRARSILRSLALPSPEKRAEKLLAIADGLRAERESLIAAIVLDAGKNAAEANAEVSEAIDFAEYYARSVVDLGRDPSVRHAPLGAVLVASPWNFPLSIPCGGVCAALACGNAVIFKPAPETPYVGRRLAEIVWSAGFDPGLELLIARDDDASRAIDERAVDAVVLTGSTETARAFRRRSPSLRLFAETGGKNAIFVSALADREAAIRDVVRSAFAYAGQKCSAASLLLLEREVYEDEGFRTRLLDAASSLPVHSAWNLDAEITPLIRAPKGALRDALLGAPEHATSWLRPARFDNERLVGPAIYGDVVPGSTLHMTELFGPVLSVMPVDGLRDALARIAATGYGLTAGIHSLSEREQEEFAATVHAGNVYVNRVITGARVGRQPFGGFGLSSFGPGEKTGGPGFVDMLATLRDEPAMGATPSSAALEPGDAALEFLDRQRERGHIVAEGWLDLLRTARADAHAMRTRFGVRVPMDLLGELDLLGYEPIPSLVCVAGDGAPRALVLRAILARLAVADLALVYGPSEYETLSGPHVLHRPLRALEADLREGRIGRMRVIGAIGERVARVAAEHDVDVIAEPVAWSPRAELRYYVRARSIAVTTHRHGILTRVPFMHHAPGASTGASRSTSKPTGTTPEGLMVEWLR